MRKILSQSEIERKKKRNLFIISMLILGVLVLGTVGYAFLDKTNTSQDDTQNLDKEYSVSYLGNSWRIVYKDQVYITSFSPDDVKNISVNIQMSLSSISNKPLFIASGNDAVTSEIASALQRYTQRAVQKACYGSCIEDLPEKNCSSNLIVWKDAPENKVYQSENCIFLEGDLRSADAFLFKLLNIPPNEPNHN
jgi:hypothetical protein